MFEVVVLQHPQEKRFSQKSHISTMESGLELLQADDLKTSLKVGLSWPNLKKALSLPAQAEASPKQWGVLYYGSGLKSVGEGLTKEVFVCDSKGHPLPVSLAQTVRKGLHGLIVLDGTWSQAKSLWWRNAWLTRCHRIILKPAHPTAYTKIRKEPHAEAWSSLEATDLALQTLHRKDEARSESIQAQIRMYLGRS